MDKATFLASGLIEKYILGLTSESEDRIVERFMESDESIKAQIFDGQDCLFEKSKEYAKAAPKAAKENIFQAINQLEQTDNDYTNISLALGKWMQYAALILLGGSVIYLWINNQKLNANNADLAQKIAVLSESLDNNNQEKATLTSNEYILTHSATERVELRGTNLSPEASMLAFYNPKAEVLMIKIDKLPPPPADKYYHMWADVDGKMIHVGSISNDAVNLTSLNFVSRASSLNVTIEDLPEVDHPNVSQLALSGAL